MIHLPQQFLRRAFIFAAICLMLLTAAGGVLAVGPETKKIADECLPDYSTVKKSSGSGSATATTKKSNALMDAIYGSSIQGGLLSSVSLGCVQCGACTLCDFLNVANQLARMIFGVFGAVALAMFIYGGVQFIISSGNAELVGKAKTTLVNAVIGIFIIAFAWQIVHVVLIVLGTPEEQGKPGVILIFGKPWDDPCGSNVKDSELPDEDEEYSNPT